MPDRQPTKRFSLDEANKMLPLIAAIVEDWVELSRDVEERTKRLEHLTAGRERSSDDPYAEELAEVQRELTKNQQRIHEYLRELRQLGVEPRDAQSGTVDIATSGEDGETTFCWMQGETEVLFGHDTAADCTARQRLTADSLPGNGDD
jgi:hypothetical protein